MDLRSVLNTSDNGERRPPKASPKSQPLPQQQHQQPVTAQSPVQYGYREYPPQASPGKPAPQDFARHPSSQYQGGNDPPPSPYQQQQQQQQQQRQQQQQQRQQQQQQREQQQREQQRELQQREQLHREQLQQREQMQREQQQQQREIQKREIQQRELQQRELQQRELQQRELQQRELQLREHQQREQQKQQQQQQHPAGYQGRPGGGPPPPNSNSYHDPRSPPASYRQAPPSREQQAGPGFPYSSGPQGPAGPPPQELQSPSQRHQYPPQHYPQQRRDSHGQSSVPSHPTTPYIQHHTVPQTPPISTPGGPHQQQYTQQRSQSTHSTPTPTSAHSQHHFGPGQISSPAVQHPMAQPDHNRNPSLPATPLGPPLQTSSRQSSFQHPPSPYQQKPPSVPPQPIALPQQQQQTPTPVDSGSNAGSRHASISRASLDASSRSLALPSDRENSLSVSPKTRVGSIPSVVSSRLSVAPEPEQKSSKPTPLLSNMDIDRDRNHRAVTPAKRKMEDRSVSPRELEHRHQRPPPGQVNGRLESPEQKQPSSPAPPVIKKRTARAQPPVWAQDARILGNKLPQHANFVLQKRVHSHINGKSQSVANIKTEPDSLNGSPEAVKSQRDSSVAAAGPAEPAAAVPAVVAVAAPSAATAATAPAEPGPSGVLGPWEVSITGVKPYEEVSKAIADFLFINVVNGDDVQEILSRGIQFEIEAKLGTLIDKDTNQRVDRGVRSECILQSNGRTAFKSSMTEVHHKAFNEFLNAVVIQADPRAPHGGNRVQVHYKHRRELDRFFELPLDLQAALPGCMRARLGSRSRNVKVRVTHDQKTQEILNKIIKARVADIDLHMPECPMDCRISINLEMNWDGTLEELEQLATHGERQPDRAKDRLSYTQGHYQVDLTQVTQTMSGPGNTQRTEKEHELEIELAPGVLIEQGRKAMTGGAHKYQELVEAFVDNVRVLARKARDFQ